MKSNKYEFIDSIIIYNLYILNINALHNFNVQYFSENQKFH